MTTLNEQIQTFLADLVRQMLDDGEAAEGDRARIEGALNDAAERLILELPALLSAIQPSFEQSLRESPGDRRAEWRTELHSIMLAQANSSAGFGTLVDEMAKAGMAKADKENARLRAEIVALQERTERLETVAHANNKWFTEGADFTRVPGNVMPTLAQVWAELLSLDPDDRLKELQLLLEQGEGRVLG